MDAYPTYHDGPGQSGATTGSTAGGTTVGGSKPTDVGLPRAKRTYALPIFIGLVAFAILILIRIVWGSMNMAATTDEAMTPGDPAAPTTAAPAAGAPPTAGTDVPEGEAATDGDADAQSGTGPGAVEATPGGADVPGGGSATETVTPAPAQ